MKIPRFEMERWQSTWENLVELNISESGVTPLTIRELLENEGDPARLLDTKLGYPQSNGGEELRANIAKLYPGATLENVLTPAAFTQMIPLAERFAEGVTEAIREAQLPWHVTRLGCRAEYLFTPQRPRNGREAAAAMDFPLERFMHLYALNRGILLTPFHNMALMSPATTAADVDQHTRAFREAVGELVS